MEEACEVRYAPINASTVFCKSGLRYSHHTDCKDKNNRRQQSLIRKQKYMRNNTGSHIRCLYLIKVDPCNLYLNVKYRG